MGALPVTSAPCLPSRTALWSGCFGIRNRGINHGGGAADPFIEGAGRGFPSRLAQTSWMRRLRQAGLKSATVSPFGERHSAWRWYASIRSYHDGYRGFPEVMLFDVVNDPHERRDLAPERPDLVTQAMARLQEWQGLMMRSAAHPQDLMWAVLNEGHSLHLRGQPPKYLKRLRETGRGEWAERLAAAHPGEG